MKITRFCVQKLDIDPINIGTGSSYKTIEEFLEDTGSSSVDEFIQNEIGTEEITNLDEYIYAIGYNGMVIIENPDGSLNYGRIESATENGYIAETGQTYTFKIRFMGIEIEKTIKLQDLSDWEWEVNDDGKTVTITSYKGNSTKVTVPDEIYGMKVTEIGSREKQSSDFLCKSIWNDSICRQTSVGSTIVYRQESIKEVILPEGIEIINNGAFNFATELQKINIPNSVISIGESSFYSCSGITSINIPDSVTSIGNSAFGWCSSLTNINIPNSVISIGESSFYSCSGITSINIPDSVTSIGNSAFGWCSSLTTINIEATTIPETWDSDWKGDCTATVNTGVKMD